jgi:hypothetical protein
MKGEYVIWKVTSDGKIDWENYGFLKNMDYEKKIATGIAFNKIYDFLLKLPDEDKLAIRLKQTNMVLIFPIIKRVFDACPVEKCVLKSPKKFVTFFVEYWEEYYPVFQNRACDTEANLCSAMVEIIVRTILSKNE